jgi:hypothetical protein
VTSGRAVELEKELFADSDESKEVSEESFWSFCSSSDEMTTYRGGGVEQKWYG